MNAAVVTVLGIAVFSAAITAGAYAANDISVRLKGDIPATCTLLNASHAGNQTFAIDMSTGDIARPGTREFGFVVDCNTPFEYRVEAQNGALAREGGGNAPSGFVTAIPYDVAVHIPTSGAPIDDRCSGADLRAGQQRCNFSTSGNDIAPKSAGKLTFAWSPQGKPIAGEYNERITIQVSMRQ